MTIQLKDGQRFIIDMDWSHDQAVGLAETLNLDSENTKFKAFVCDTGALFVRSEDIKYIYVGEHEL